MQDKAYQLQTESEPTRDDRQNESAEAQTDLAKERQRGGVPNVESELWEAQAAHILNDIRKYVSPDPNAIGIPALGQAVLRDRVSDDVAFRRFLKIRDDFDSQLILLVEQKDCVERRNRAGRELADRLRGLLAQHRAWCNDNQGFAERWKQFGDKARRTHAPRSFLGWLAGDYLRRLMDERRLAPLLLSACDSDGLTFAQALDYSEQRIVLLKRLAATPDFSPDTAKQWGELVFARMQQDEKEILESPMMNNESSESDRRASRRAHPIRIHGDKMQSDAETGHKVLLAVLDHKPAAPKKSAPKLGDYNGEIVKAVKSLAKKPVGDVRGITRPR